MRKRRNRIYRRIAVALTVALLAGQSHAFVLAEESTEDVPQTEISSVEIGEDTPGGSNAADDGNADSGDTENNDGTEQGGENNSDAADQEPGYDNNPETDQQPGDGGNPEDDENTENNIPDKDGGENTDDSADGQGQCICETACTEEAVNGDCPVCTVDYANCAQNVGEEVNFPVEVVLPEMMPEKTLDAEVGIAALADEGVEAYADGDEITYDGIKYVVTGDGEVEVGVQGVNAVSGDIIIPESFEQDGVTYRVTSIGASAFDLCYNLTNVQIPESVTSIGEWAFANCTCLTDIEIPKNVIYIGGFLVMYRFSQYRNT